jgi:hypothetical protein
MGLFTREVSPAEVPPVAGRRARSASWGQHRAITASAEKINLKNPLMLQVTQNQAEWQTAAWTGYNRVGEIHYGFGLLANLLSRVRIYAAVVNESNEAPSDLSQLEDDDRISENLAEAATAAIAELTLKDFASFVRKFSLNMSVPGECYLVHMPPVEGGEKAWIVCSKSELVIRTDSIQYLPLRGGQRRELPKDTYVARMWRQSPEYTMEADSSMIGVQDSVEELLLCQRLTRGAARSRMNAGVLFIPDGITTARTGATAEAVIEEPDDDISGLTAMAQQDPRGDMVNQLMDAMVTPIGDEGSAAGVVPLVLVGPTDQGMGIRHVSFERNTDEWLVKRGEIALDRILQGIDIPKEVVTGMQAVKYSNAVVISEDLYKANVEPLALVLADSLTTVYLRPVLKAAGFTDEQLKEIVVWYDPSEIVTRPNSSESATQGVDRNLLSHKAWRREHGYAESDAPSLEEIALSKLAELPEAVQLQVLAKVFKGFVDVDEDPEPAPQERATARPLAAVKDDTEKDPQRVAIQQVGIK